MAVVMGVVCICGISPIKNKPLLETGCYITMYETFINLIMSTIIYFYPCVSSVFQNHHLPINLHY